MSVFREAQYTDAQASFLEATFEDMLLPVPDHRKSRDEQEVMRTSEGGTLAFITQVGNAIRIDLESNVRALRDGNRPIHDVILQPLGTIRGEQLVVSFLLAYQHPGLSKKAGIAIIPDFYATPAS